jgi:hypothetical protein
MAATIALAMSGPMLDRYQLPATLAPLCRLFDLLGNALDALIEPPPIIAEVLDDRIDTR